MSSEDRARDAGVLQDLRKAGLLDVSVVRRWLDAEWGGVDGSSDAGDGA